MSKLRPPSLGPIVGHTSSSSTKIWVSGAVENEGANIDENRRTLGVISITHKNGVAVDTPQAFYFRLKREYERTGVFNLGVDSGIKEDSASVQPLEPNTNYSIKVGILHIDDPHPNAPSASAAELALRLPDANVWLNELELLNPDESEVRVTTFAEEPSADHDLSFILGSCRYPGLLWKTKHSDAIFGPLLEEALGQEGRDPVQMTLMVGDQIYADMFNRHIPVGLADSFEEFQQRYHSAFGSRNMRKLLRHIPTYMILDDHEIEDNWSQDRITKSDSRRIFNYAINAYRSYQWIHGPTNYGQRLFYDFQCLNYPFFVLDSRTQRYMDDTPNSLEDNHLLGRPSLSNDEPSQLNFLLHWLKQSQDANGDAPKFIVSASVFAPNPIDSRSGRKGELNDKVRWCEHTDSWPAFPKTREAILAHIIEHNIQNVIFLSGDIHCSNVAELSFTGSEAAKQLKAFSIVSSAFYWPFPFADGEPSSFVHDSKARDQKDTFDFKVKGKPYAMDYKAWNFNQEDNFNRIDIDAKNNKVLVTTFGKKGQVLETGGWFPGTPSKTLRTELKLAPW